MCDQKFQYMQNTDTYSVSLTRLCYELINDGAANRIDGLDSVVITLSRTTACLLHTSGFQLS